MFVAAKVGMTPETGLLLMSCRVIVTEELATPFATTELVPVMVELTAAAAPPTKLTVFVTLVRPVGAVMLNVFDSATVVLIVPVVCPLASVTAPG